MIILDDHISFNDNDIIKWNTKLNLPISVQPQYNNGNYIDIIICETLLSYQNPISYGKPDRITEPTIDHKISLSVPIEYVEIFKEIFNDVSKLKMMSRISMNGGNYEIPQPSVIIKEVEHTLNKKDYLRLEYSINGKISSIIMYDKFISTTNDIFNMMINMSFEVGSIVSTKDDKGKNYIVKNYKFRNNELRYTLIEILENSSPIIKYGDEITLRKEEVCASRDNRIEQILNKSEDI